MKQVGGTPDQFTVYAWDARLAFADAIDAVVAKDGINGITRRSFVTGIKTLTALRRWRHVRHARFKDGKTTPCFARCSSRAASGCASTRRRPGTFDCKSANAIAVQANLLAS